MMVARKAERVCADEVMRLSGRTPGLYFSGISLSPREARGHRVREGVSYIVAPFTHPDPCGDGFSSGTYGVLWLVE
jgi:hypothetical protein